MGDKKRGESGIVIGWSRTSRGEASKQGRRILEELLAREYGVEWTGEEEIGKGEKGKPYLISHPEIHFSLSHSGEFVICSIGEVPMGIDIQYHKKGKLERMGEKLFTPGEKKEFAESGGEAEIFYRYWTKKESYLKYTGQGIACDLSKLEYKGVRFQEIHLWPEYSGMLCVPGSWVGTVEIMAEIV